jgi:hypothetical protein
VTSSRAGCRRWCDPNRSYLTVAVGCTGGQHRSVYLAERLSDHFSDGVRGQALVRHRDLESRRTSDACPRGRRMPAAFDSRLTGAHRATSAPR